MDGYTTTDSPGPHSWHVLLPKSGGMPSPLHIVDPCGGFKKHGGIFLPKEVIAEEVMRAGTWQQQYQLWRAQRWVALKSPPPFILT